MNKQITDILAKLGPTLVFVKRYLTFGVVIAFLCIYSFLIYRVNNLANREPSEANVTDVLKAIPRPKVDKTVVNKIQQLQAQNVEVKSLFDQARKNPFSE